MRDNCEFLSFFITEKQFLQLFTFVHNNSIWFQPSLRGQLAERQDQQLRDCLFPEVFMTKMVEVMAAMVSVHNSLSETLHKPAWPPANETSPFTAI